jgi:hypothetical protein
VFLLASNRGLCTSTGIGSEGLLGLKIISLLIGGGLCLGSCPFPGLIGRPVSGSAGQFSFLADKSFNLGG